MTENPANASTNADNARSPQELTAFRAELDASALALDAALHFDDRAGVKPAYDRLMRLAQVYRELPHRLAGTAPACPAAPAATASVHGETIAIVVDILDVLADLSAGVERYHVLAGRLAGLRHRLGIAGP